VNTLITLLSRIFIKKHKNISSPAVRRAYGVLCGTVGIVLNIILFTLKMIAGTISGSIAITADAFNNLSDAASSVIAILGFRLAAKTPDRDHPFGHGRIEYISGLIVSFLILLMGYELGKSSVEKLFHPVDPQISAVSLIILTVSILIKAYMAVYNKRIGKKIHSAALSATSADSLSDCIATALVLFSGLIHHFFAINIDAWCGIAVSLFIFWSGIRSAIETVDSLLGKTPDPEFVRSVEKIILSNRNIRNLHDLIVHDYGPGRVMISVHAEVSAEEDIMVLHDSIDNTERKLMSELGCEAVIHMDPIAENDEETNRLLIRMTDLISKIDPRLTMHDFRIVSGPSHTNLIFDVVVPFEFPMTDKELKKIIVDEVLSYDDGEYFAVVTIDKSYY